MYKSVCTFIGIEMICLFHHFFDKKKINKYINIKMINIQRIAVYSPLDALLITKQMRQYVLYSLYKL